MQKSHLISLAIKGLSEFDRLQVTYFPLSSSALFEPKNLGAHLISVRDEVKS